MPWELAIEFRAPGTFKPVTGYRSGGPHGLAPGEWHRRHQHGPGAIRQPSPRQKLRHTKTVDLGSLLMPVDLSKSLVIGISSSALFDMDEADLIFRKEGLDAYRSFQFGKLTNR